MSDTLVLYYSRSGVTDTLARRLAARLGADLERVRPVADYGGGAGYLRGVWQALRGASPAVEPPTARARGPHDLIVVGAPVWAGRLAPPMRSYLHGVRKDVRRVAAFWVSGSGAPYAGVGAEIGALTGRPPAAIAHFSEREVARGLDEARLDAFVAALREPAGPSSPL